MRPVVLDCALTVLRLIDNEYKIWKKSKYLHILKVLVLSHTTF